MIKAMAEEWFVRVEGKDYGPADLEMLRDWRREGRVLPANPVRQSEGAVWITAAEIPGLFEATHPPVRTHAAPSGRETTTHAEQAAAPISHRSLGAILSQTLAIYRAGFFQFLALALLTILPSICGQLTAAFVKTSPKVDVDLRTVVAGLFSLSMFALMLVLWPIYIAAIQILTAEFAAGRRLGFFAALNQAVRFWPRVGALCLFVYGVFLLITLFGLLILAIPAASASLFSVVLALGLLVLQIWMFGRFFITVLFWQQFAVLEDVGVVDSLRSSKALARSGAELPWFRRPLCRGALIASIWFAFVLLIALAQEWPHLRNYASDLMTAQDPQAILQKLAAAQETQGIDPAALALSLMQRIFQPLLGIAFVVLYLDNRTDLKR
jgi:GYF domain 2